MTETATVSEVTVDLSILSQSIDENLTAGYIDRAAGLAQAVLIRLPRHLLTYQQLLQAAWLTRRWQEGEDWARRLLQADPVNPLAWRSLAWAVEQKGMRQAARAIWKRAFEADPYAPEIRSGLSRTSLEVPDALTLDQACLACLYFRSRRWSHAAGAYRALVEADGRRIDFQVRWMAALWQQGARGEAYRIARHLTRKHPHLLAAWVVLDAVGDVDDRALARNPIGSMDPTGDYMRAWLRIPYAAGSHPCVLSPSEAALLE